ncbi:MAG TPA: GNAT family N-acetyltransferase, partial [Gemmatimonadaceae bacterium]
MSNGIALQRWTVDDLPVLERTNTPQMTAFLGGPETHEKLEERNERYARGWETGAAAMFTIRLEGERDAVGSVGSWPTMWHDLDVYETGWAVTEPFQGRGIASRAVAAVLKHATEHGDRELVLAFPRVDNSA